jgi:class 3 adenylate cyclase
LAAHRLWLNPPLLIIGLCIDMALLMGLSAVGARNRLLYTVHGDEVNIAARLEQLNKKYATYILATDSTVRGADAEFAFRRVDRVIVRGRAAPTVIYTLESQAIVRSAG